MSGKDRVQRGVAAALLLLLVACGGGKTATRDDDGTGGSGSGNDQTELTDAEKFQAAHYQACEYMCDLLTRCAAVELRANLDQLSPEDRAAAEEIGPRELQENTNRCVAGCQASELSVRQVEAIRACVSGMPTEGDPPLDQCQQYLGCLDDAQPKG